MNHQLVIRIFRPVPGALVAVLVALLVSCGFQASNTIARSDLGPVSRSDLDEFILALDEPSRSPSQGEDPAVWRRGLLEKLLIEKALIGEIEASQVEVDPAWMDQVRGEALIRAFEDQFIEPEIVIDEEELRNYYDSHPEEFGHPEQIRLRHIFKRLPRGASASEKARVRAEMEEMLGRIREGAHFGDLARQYSDSETAPLNGLIGRLSRGALDPSLEDIVWGLDEGDVSEVVPTPVGFHIFFLEDRLDVYHMEFKEARGRLLRKMQAEERERALRDSMADLLAESGAEYHPERIDSTDPDEVLFELGDSVVTVATLQAYAGRVPFYQLRKVPPAEWLDTACRNRLFVWKAEQLELGQSTGFKESLEAVVRRSRLVEAYASKMREKVDRLEADGVIEQHWDQHYLRFQSPKLYHLHLVLKAFEDLEKNYDAFEMLEAARAEILSGKRRFSDVAEAISDDFSAISGGDVGWVRLDSFGQWSGPRANSAVRALQPGEISEPVLVEYYDESRLRYRREGYILVKVEEIRDPEIRPYEEVRVPVREAYAKQHQQELEQALIQEILDSIDAEIFEEQL
ncbi:MAG: hypothetical protein DRJ61_08415 [Acidobacteria bacterium]|nr:MAG: hypothetical protein DRJ61_08415 [Acidobacteriota bacterium]